MTGFFLDFVKVSLSAGVLIAVILCLRYVLKQTDVPKWLICALWALVAVKLICPVLPEADFSLTPRWERVDDWADAYYGDTRLMFPEAEGYQEAVDAGIRPYGPDQYVVTGADGISPPPTVETEWVPVLVNFWLMGAAAMGLWALFSWLRLRHQVAASVEENGIFLCDHLKSPFILGLIFPKIYLPSDLTGQARAVVMAHERAHLSRHDHWWKALGFLLLSLHWFNPMMWAAYILLCRDIEAACDEKVVKNLDLEDRKTYAQALLNLSLPRRQVAACPLAFGEVNVKERVVNVLNYKRVTAFVLALALLAGGLLAGCFLTTAPASLEEAARTYTEDSAREDGCLVREESWLLTIDLEHRLIRFLEGKSDTLRIAEFPDHTPLDAAGCKVYEVVREKDGYLLRQSGEEERHFPFLREEVGTVPASGGTDGAEESIELRTYFLCDREDVSYEDCVRENIPCFRIAARQGDQLFLLLNKFDLWRKDNGLDNGKLTGADLDRFLSDNSREVEELVRQGDSTLRACREMVGNNNMMSVNAWLMQDICIEILDRASRPYPDPENYLFAEDWFLDLENPSAMGRMTPLEEAARIYTRETAEAEGCLVQQDLIPAPTAPDRMETFMSSSLKRLRVADFKWDAPESQVYEIIRQKDGYLLRTPGEVDRTFRYLRKETWLRSIPTTEEVPGGENVTAQTTYFLCDREDLSYVDCFTSQNGGDPNRKSLYFPILTLFHGSDIQNVAGIHTLCKTEIFASGDDWDSGFYTLDRGEGNGVLYAHENTADHPVRVTLYQKTWTGQKQVGFLDVPAHGRGQGVYSGGDSGSYLLSVDAIPPGETVSGQALLAQCSYAP